METGASLASAALALQQCFDAEEPGLTAVLARYDGACTVVRFAGFCAGEVGVEESGVGADVALLAHAGWDTDAAAYRQGVERVRELIADGDVYVLNLTARLAGELAVGSPAEAFAALRTRAGADMGALLDGLPGATPWIASVSPERFVRIRRDSHGAREVEVHPIKGTRPRGATADADAALAAQLHADPKERAEHVMVVDLERNDLGRACEPGSVHVDPLYEVVTTPYCHQLVSEVRGTMRDEATFAELLGSMFPCGSVTGAPKHAAMRICDEIEATPRGAYCGALLVAISGELDSSVLIRTLEGDAEEPGRASWGAGCGITHDSDPAAEHLEMLLKASPVSGDGAPPVALRETMRVVAGGVPLLDRHLARLASGGCGPSVLALARAEVAAELTRAVRVFAGRLSVTVTPDGCVAVGVSEERSTLDVPGGVAFHVVTVAEVPVLPPHAAKPAARRYWDRAHAAARIAGADQAVLVDAAGRVIDGSTANVWLVVEGALVTPPAGPSIAGVARGLVSDLAHSMGIAMRITEISVAELAEADEVFFTNAHGGLVAAAGRGGPVSEMLRVAFEAQIESLEIRDIRSACR